MQKSSADLSVRLFLSLARHTRHQLRLVSSNYGELFNAAVAAAVASGHLAPPSLFALCAALVLSHAKLRKHARRVLPDTLLQQLNLERDT